jgi:hypothetical protein
MQSPGSNFSILNEVPVIPHPELLKTTLQVNTPSAPTFWAKTYIQRLLVVMAYPHGESGMKNSARIFVPFHFFFW